MNLLSPFKKKVDNNKKVDSNKKVDNDKKIDHSATILEIHNSFNIAAELALAEARKIISQPSDDKMKDLADKLVLSGFLRSPMAQKVNKMRAEVNRASKRAELVIKYQQKYPQYKLIFLDQVIGICNKYDLVFGDVSLYKGDVPEKNINEISDFKVQDEDTYYIRVSNYLIDRKDITSEIVRSRGDYISKDIYIRMKNRENSHDIIQSVPFFICAPEKDMVTEDYKRNGAFLVKKQIPDPIVLHFISDDAFLIVSKWGLEGQDELLVNEKMN
ncbi:MAG TPA: hypothetical protein VIQ04_03655 [Nitrososphaeraceae archaeon]